MKRRTGIVLVVAALGSSAATAIGQQGSTPSRDVVLAKETQLTIAAKTRLGERWFGCVTVPGKNDVAAPLSELRLFVTSNSRRARRAALNTAASVGAQRFTTIRVIDARHGWAASMRIDRYLRAHIPIEDREHVSISTTTNTGRSHCPRVLVTVRELASQAARDWAYAAQRAFGADRVAVWFPPPGTPVPD